MNLKTETAVQWLKNCLSIHLTTEQQKNFEGLFDHAMWIEKNRIIDAFIEGEHQQGFEGEAEEYYNKIYLKKSKSEL